MAISAAAMTLADYAQFSNSPLIRRIIFTLREAGSLFVDVPFITKKTLIATGSRWTTVPGVSWVKLNSPPVDVSGRPDPLLGAGVYRPQ